MLSTSWFLNMPLDFANVSSSLWGSEKLLFANNSNAVVCISEKLNDAPPHFLELSQF